jgi:biopolymer transport protein ExbD
MRIRKFIIVLVVSLLAGCGGEKEIEDYSAQNIRIIVAEDWYEIEGKRSKDIVSLYYEKAASIAEKNKIQVILDASENVKYARIEESIKTLKESGIESVSLASK